MKKIISIAIVLLFTSSLFAANGLVVTQKYFDNHVKSNVTVTWYVQGSQCKMKMNFADDKVSTTNWFIPDFANHNLLTYTEGNVPAGTQKAFYTIPVQGIKADKDREATRVEVEKTGELKTISGMNCELIKLHTNKSVTEMWVTKDFAPDYFLAYPYFQNSAELTGLFEQSVKGFPLQSVTKDLSGNTIYSYDLISATPTELSASDFQVPAEYKNAKELSTKKN